VRGVTVDLADARIVNALLPRADGEPGHESIAAALAAKDAAGLRELVAGHPAPFAQALLSLIELYGDASVLRKARAVLPASAALDAALTDLQWLSQHLGQTHPEVCVGFDLADLGGYAYYSGARFAIYTRGANDALVRGGRYDEVGAIFGRNRPAVGFSLDLKTLAELAPGNGARAAIRAPWGEDPGQRDAVRSLRRSGETVVCMLPGHEHEAQEFECDRELVSVGDRWVVRAL
jgi:ATP phosphoribosyltransferase regulatory subunit